MSEIAEVMQEHFERHAGRVFVAKSLTDTELRELRAAGLQVTRLTNGFRIYPASKLVIGKVA